MSRGIIGILSLVHCHGSFLSRKSVSRRQGRKQAEENSDSKGDGKSQTAVLLPLVLFVSGCCRDTFRLQPVLPALSKNALAARRVHEALICKA